MTITEQYNQDEKLSSLYKSEEFLEFQILNPNYSQQIKDEYKVKLASVRTEIFKMLNLMSK